MVVGLLLLLLMPLYVFFLLLLPSVHAWLYPVPALVCFSLLPRYFIFCTLAC